MTWDYEWGYSSRTNCRGKICRTPFYDRATEPEVEASAGSCRLERGEVCVKQVIYDRRDRKTP
jgi:hypothetical protein